LTFKRATEELVVKLLPLRTVSPQLSYKRIFAANSAEGLQIPASADVAGAIDHSQKRVAGSESHVSLQKRPKTNGYVTEEPAQSNRGQQVVKTEPTEVEDLDGSGVKESQTPQPPKTVYTGKTAYLNALAGTFEVMVGNESFPSLEINLFVPDVNGRGNQQPLSSKSSIGTWLSAEFISTYLKNHGAKK
jgi:hypothetical protein